MKDGTTTGKIAEKTNKNTTARTKDTRNWVRLDNAAKIFPPNSTKRDTKVFRFSSELFEPVAQDKLQIALDKTVEKFPFYRYVIKKGFFWYYFEESTIKPVVKEETKPPCGPIYHNDKKTLLFEVSYYKNRINLDIYHALADGTGAMAFLRTLTFYYLKEQYKDEIDPFATIDYDMSNDEKMQDSFLKYYEKQNAMLKEVPQKAYRIRGERFTGYKMGVIEGRMSVKEILEKAHDYKATMSEFLAAILICAIHDGMSLRDEAYPVTLSIPVNLRNFFPADSARNFFGVVNISHDFKTQGNTLEDVIENVRQALKAQLTKEQLANRMNKLASLERSMLKLIPLFLKIPVLKIAGYIVDREITATFSNIGRVTMPEAVADRIKMFDIFCSTRQLQVCLCSYDDILTVSFTSGFVSSGIQRRFFRTITDLGIAVSVTSNITEED